MYYVYTYIYDEVVLKGGLMHFLYLPYNITRDIIQNSFSFSQTRDLPIGFTDWQWYRLLVIKYHSWYCPKSPGNNFQISTQGGGAFKKVSF